MKSEGKPQEEYLNLLPGKITSIQVQKNNSERFSIFVDGQFLIGVPVRCLSEFGLQKGAVITIDRYHELSAVDQESRLADFFLGLLARRSYSRFELLTRAEKKGYGPATAENILNRFEEKGWIDDREFALMYAREQLRLRRWGPNKIISALLSKGVANKIARTAVQSVVAENDMTEMLFTLVKKRKARFRREANLLKRKKKILDFLARKGFSSEIIYENLEQLVGEVER